MPEWFREIFAYIREFFCSLINLTDFWRTCALFFTISIRAEDKPPGDLSHLVDKNGKMPGDTGYYGPAERKAPKNFAEYQAELKAAKEAKAAAEKK